MYPTVTAVVAIFALLARVSAQHDDSDVSVTLDSGCKSFLDALDTNDKLATCLKSVTDATSAFSSVDDSLAASSADVEGALNTLCASTACATEDIASLLTQFAAACPTDLVNVQDVSAQYDMLYNLVPIKNSLCIKDGATFCALKKAVVGPADALQLPDGDMSQIVMANLDAMGAANLGFLFMRPDSPVTALCSTCFQDVLAAYVDWEDTIPYEIGVNLSPLLQGQAQLWASVTTNCSAEVAANVAVKGGAAPESAASLRATVPASLAAAAVALVAGVFALAL
ncbi:hypothetical protein BKA62DRAFT_699044 [Auriculariales sp. MPI-PUGE-AT-0066]|nr:hypothetical protein BKA62DRAFT_699044 [Auriculariales sp. MPI-PUGE-AT-0066]